MPSTLARLAASESSAPLTTVSIGVATSPIAAPWTAEQLIQLADLRLVVAKKRSKPSRHRAWSGQLPAGWLPEALSTWPGHPGLPAI